MQITVKQNSKEERLRFLLYESDNDGNVMTGISSSSPEISAAYIRDGESPREIVLVTGDSENFIAGGLREIDAQQMPGLYELALPNEVCASGAQHVTLMIRSPQIQSLIITIDLVAYDPYDRDRLGLDCLSREGRHAVISRAFREVVPEIVEQFMGNQQNEK